MTTGGLVSHDCFEKNLPVSAILQAVLHIFNYSIILIRMTLKAFLRIKL